MEEHTYISGASSGWSQSHLAAAVVPLIPTFHDSSRRIAVDFNENSWPVFSSELRVPSFYKHDFERFFIDSKSFVLLEATSLI